MARSILANETDLWLIPKRGSIHQVWCLIDGIITRKADGKSWGPNMQNNLGVNLKNWGATRDGRNISQQAIRTLVAFAQYLGLVYIDGSSTPSVIRITQAGYKFWQEHKDNINQLRNLSIDSNLELKTSDCVKLQMEKLQLTNPIQAKKCTNVLLFPFRMTLKLISELQYLDTQELAIFLFSMQSESDYDFISLRIKEFREMPIAKRKKYVESYKKTKFGNITLVKAPSTGYYISLCERTNLIKQGKEFPSNWTSSKLGTIRIKDGMEEYVKNILNNTYSGIEPYDFGEDVRLWIEYFGDPKQKYTPISSKLTNKSGNELFVSVLDKNKINLASQVLEHSQSIVFPAFPDCEYSIIIFDKCTNKFKKEIVITPSKIGYSYSISNISNSQKHKECFKEFKDNIIEHISSSSFTSEATKLLTAIKIINGIDKTSDKSLRGAYLEYYFFKLLQCLKSSGVIDDVIWNGNIGQLGLPNAAPGGKIGKCDILFFIDDIQYVLELTTMKNKSGQEKGEATAVPDHVRLAAKRYKGETIGLYSAPYLHDRVTAMMLATASSYDIKLRCISIKDLLEILSVNKKAELKLRLQQLS